MTAPGDDELDRALSQAARRQLVRELIGLLAVLAGLVVIAVVLGTVDLRLAIAMGGGALIAGGLWLGRDGRD